LAPTPPAGLFKSSLSDFDLWLSGSCLVLGFLTALAGSGSNLGLMGDELAVAGTSWIWYWVQGGSLPTSKQV
jgi:hypothetical protein